MFLTFDKQNGKPARYIEKRKRNGREVTSMRSGKYAICQRCGAMFIEKHNTAGLYCSQYCANPRRIKLSTSKKIKKARELKQSNSVRGRSKALEAIHIATGEILEFGSMQEANDCGFKYEKVRECIEGKIPYYRLHYWKFIK